MRSISQFLAGPILLGLVAVAIAPTPAAGDTYDKTTLVHFSGVDGQGPEATMILGTDGNFYGTTIGNFYEGTTSFDKDGSLNGTVFMMTPAGAKKTLHVFSGSNGQNPKAPLVEMSNGYLYGTTSGGFSGNGATIFRIKLDGTDFATLVYCEAKGSQDNVWLCKGSDGNLWGMQRQGGSIQDGSIFKMTTSGEKTLLHDFNNPNDDGEFPSGPLIQAKDGNFYGCTEAGPEDNGDVGMGLIFRISLSGDYKVLHALVGDDGSGPISLVQAGDDDLYGVCQQGGDVNGTLFRISTSGAFKKLIDFGDAAGSATMPESGLTLGPDGDLWGAGLFGGVTNTGYGAVFRVTTGGEYLSVHSFDGVTGAYPFAGVVFGKDKNVYGSTGGKIAETDDTSGGDQKGTLFKITVDYTTSTEDSVDERDLETFR